MGDSGVIASQKTMRYLEDVVEMALTLARLRPALWRCRRKWDKHRWRSTWRPAELWLCTVRRKKIYIYISALTVFYTLLFACRYLFTVKPFIVFAKYLPFNDTSQGEMYLFFQCLIMKEQRYPLNVLRLQPLSGGRKA